MPTNYYVLFFVLIFVLFQGADNNFASGLLQYNGKLDVSLIFYATIKGKAENSLKSYKSAFSSWKKFALKNELIVFPMNKVEFTVFLITKAEEGACWSTLNMYISAAKFFLKLFQKSDASLYLVDTQISNFLKKHCRKPNNKKRPLSKAEFDRIIKGHSHLLNSILILRNLTLIIFGWIGFMRFSDLSQIRFCNVNVNSNRIKILLFNAKNDKFKKGQSVNFRLNDDLFNIVMSYIRLSGLKGLSSNKDVFLFCSINNESCNLFDPISYKEMRLVMYALCDFVGIDTEKIGTHSLRIGGCSEASRRGVPDYILDFHGRWALNSCARARYQRVEGEDVFHVSDVLSK